MISMLAAVAIAFGTWIYVPGGTWTPSQEVVHAAAAQLEGAVKQQAAKEHLSLPTWSGYTFQYQGRTLQVQGNPHESRKVLYVYGFCPQPPVARKWLEQHAHQQFMLVLDGGTCYFQAYYDPVAKKYLLVIFNGVA